MKNEGKGFEKDIKASITDQFYLRLQDAGGWSDANNTRFTPANICDCLIFASDWLYLVEMKSHKGKSIPVSCLKQLPNLLKVDKAGVVPCFLLNFRDLEETYFIEAKQVSEGLTGRKSISIAFCRIHGILIGQRKLRVRFRYELTKVF